MPQCVRSNVPSGPVLGVFGLFSRTVPHKLGAPHSKNSASGRFSCITVHRYCVIKTETMLTPSRTANSLADGHISYLVSYVYSGLYDVMVTKSGSYNRYTTINFD